MLPVSKNMSIQFVNLIKFRKRVLKEPGFFKGLGPAVSHSGFCKIRMGRRSLAAGDWFHDLHHRHFEVNYGNVEAPFDWARGTWHDGSEVAKKEMVRRRIAQNSTGIDGHAE